MTRRLIAPVLRLLLAIFILLLPLLLAAVAQATETDSRPRLVSVRAVAVTEGPSTRSRVTGRLAASRPAAELERRGGSVRIEAGPLRGWAESDAFLVLDDASTSIDALVDRARLVLSQGNRPVLAAALLSEVVRRDPSRVDAWVLYGNAGEEVARACAVPGPCAAAAAALAWGVRVDADAGSARYDGAAYRRALALPADPNVAEEAATRLLTRCGPTLAAALTDRRLAEERERSLADFTASFPGASSRLTLLLERARLLSFLAEADLAAGDRDAASRRRDAAIEVASEVASASEEPRRRRSADRLVARLTKSFPRRTDSAAPLVSPSGLSARIAVRGGDVVLFVERRDGRSAIQPHPVPGIDPLSLSFDPAGARLAWDEVPARGLRRTRVLDLSTARLAEPAALALPEVLVPAGSAPSDLDRYTSFVGFSPDGRLVLVSVEGFLGESGRIPRRYFVCDADGRGAPRQVVRPLRGDGRIDWEALLSRTDG